MKYINHKPRTLICDWSTTLVEEFPIINSILRFWLWQNNYCFCSVLYLQSKPKGNILAEKWWPNTQARYEIALSKHHQVKLYSCFIVSNPLIITMLCDILQLDNVADLHIVILNINCLQGCFMLCKGSRYSTLVVYKCLSLF